MKFFGAIVLGLLLAPLSRAAENVVIVMPVANISGDDSAPATVQGWFADEIRRRGWTTVPMDQLDPVLEEKRVRYLDSVPAAIRGELLAQFNASAIVFGTVVAYRNGGHTLVSLSARMINAEGEMVWGDLASRSSSESETVLGFGAGRGPETIGRSVTHDLFRRFPKPGKESRIGKGPGGGLLKRDPATYRSAHHARGDAIRVCILPFTTSIPDASRVVMEILTVRLESLGEFDVVEPAEFREAMRAAKLYSISSMTSAELATLSTHLGTSVFLRGNIHAFRESSGGRSEVQLDMTLADVRTGEVLWAVVHQRHGLEYSGLFQRGTVTTAVGLADRVITEAITAQARARLREGPTHPSAVTATKEP